MSPHKQESWHDVYGAKGTPSKLNAASSANAQKIISRNIQKNNPVVNGPIAEAAEEHSSKFSLFESNTADSPGSAKFEFEK